MKFLRLLLYKICAVKLYQKHLCAVFLQFPLYGLVEKNPFWLKYLSGIILVNVKNFELTDT